MNEIDKQFEEIMEEKSENRSKDYFILDGTQSSYELREEIKSWGGYWNKAHKCWCIDAIKETDRAFCVLKNIGLKLQYRRN